MDLFLSSKMSSKPYMRQQHWSAGVGSTMVLPQWGSICKGDLANIESLQLNRRLIRRRLNFCESSPKCRPTAGHCVALWSKPRQFSSMYVGSSNYLNNVPAGIVAQVQSEYLGRNLEQICCSKYWKLARSLKIMLTIDRHTMIHNLVEDEWYSLI